MSASGDSYGLFWQSSNGDRTYNADSLERWLKHFFRSGVFTGELQVLASSGMTVNVETGYANVDGKVMMFASETQITLDPPNSRYPRIDNIVVERNDTDRQITLKKVTGEYSGPDPEPTPPVRENGVYQLVLAHIYVGAGASSIVQANITDTRSDPDICGIVTGTVTEMDFSQFAAQFNDYIEQFEITYEADFEAWSDAQMAAFTLWMTNTQADFDAWYAAIQASLHNLPPDSAEYLQVEINDLQEEIEGIQSSSVRSWNGRSGSVMPIAGDYDASMIDYDNSNSGLTSNRSQGAIDELTPKKIITSDDAFDPTKTYTAGEWFIHQGVLYEVITACTGITPPNATYYNPITLHELKNRIDTLQSYATISVPPVSGVGISANSNITLTKIGNIVQGTLTITETSADLSTNTKLFEIPNGYRPIETVSETGAIYIPTVASTSTYLYAGGQTLRIYADGGVYQRLSTSSFNGKYQAQLCYKTV